jgi:hypothetical protein
MHIQIVKQALQIAMAICTEIAVPDAVHKPQSIAVSLAMQVAPHITSASRRAGGCECPK